MCKMNSAMDQMPLLCHQQLPTVTQPNYYPEPINTLQAPKLQFNTYC